MQFVILKISLTQVLMWLFKLHSSYIEDIPGLDNSLDCILTHHGYTLRDIHVLMGNVIQCYVRFIPICIKNEHTSTML